MSLINQVLNDLEKRGASTSIGEATVHVVPLRQGHGKLWLLVAAISLPVLAATAWLKWGAEIRQNAPSQTQLAAVPQSGVQPVAALAPEAAQIAIPPVDLPAIAPPPATGTAAEPPLATAPENLSLAAAKPLAITAPVITAVSPNPVISLSLPQALTISGKYFAPDAAVILHTPAGNVYLKHKIIVQDAAQIVIRTNLREKAGTWSVAVENASDSSSSPYAFTVQLAPETARLAPRNKADAGDQSVAAPKTATAALSPAAMPPAIKQANGISKQPSQTTPQQQAENEFRKAYELMRQGHTTDAISGYETALKLDAGHVAARQILVRLLLENKRQPEAERLLQEGLQHDPRQSSLAMLLARLQVARNELGQALETMQKSLPHAQQQADYQAFVAGLLQRLNNHKEAINYYQSAVLLSPNSGVWLMGLGISLRAEQRKEEARDAFNRALESNSLSAELKAYVTQQLKEL